ncbi:ribonuclease HII [bacterium]|nr:ribonuclease HII [bacterium]
MPTFPDKRLLFRMSISRIRALLEETTPDDTVIDALSSDKRAGVRALARKIENERSRKNNLRAKHERLLAIERSLMAEGKKLIAGVDEAGRGPLAGPVVAGAVILPDGVCLLGLDDSKKMTAKHREEMFERITSQAVAWGIGMAENDEIDEIGILEATMKAMRIAVENLHVRPDIVIVDGNRAPGLPCEERAVVDGDALSLSVAAASVIAKVSRDRIMADMDGMFPGYGFARHKGYGCSSHIEAIRRLGPCDIHRFSFGIVPESAPPGTVFAILKKRLLKAMTGASFDRAAQGIARIRDHIPESELEILRKVYCDRRAKLKKTTRNTGAHGEKTGCEFLMHKGYAILDRNWRADGCGYEIDIVARHDETVVFCEVKTANTAVFGEPVSWVTPEKTRHIARAASEYIVTHNLGGCPYRFDVIGLQMKGELSEIVHIENAFNAPENL